MKTQPTQLIPIAGLALAILVELLLISISLDARALLEHEPAENMLMLLPYSGDLAKLVVLFIVVLGLLLGKRLRDYAGELVTAIHRGRPSLFCVHTACYCSFLYLSFMLFSSAATGAPPSAAVSSAWLCMGLASGVLWMWALAPAGFWLGLISRENRSMVAALAISSVIWLLAQYTGELWGPLSDATFQVSAYLLGLQGDNVVIYPDDKILGSGDFIVSIAAACSGYEGIGLILAFTGLYLYVYRSDFRFPQAFLLFPLGAVCIWLLNSVRIVALILIGSAWSPDIAVGGFHSQAGWIIFICCALGILMLAHGSRYFSNGDVAVGTAAGSGGDQPFVNLPIATLVPLVILLAATLLTTALSAGFAWLYPLRVLLTGIAIAYCWRFYRIDSYRLRAAPVLVAITVAVMWVCLVPSNPEIDALHVEALAEAPVLLSALWLVFRFIGAAVTVPIAEELAFRAYLLCRASSREVVVRGRLPLSIVGLAASSVAFGLLHGAWLAGTLAGFMYGILRLRSDTVVDTIVAHAITNALLFAFVLFSGRWYLL